MVLATAKTGRTNTDYLYVFDLTGDAVKISRAEIPRGRYGPSVSPSGEYVAIKYKISDSEWEIVMYRLEGWVNRKSNFQSAGIWENARVTSVSSEEKLPEIWYCSSRRSSETEKEYTNLTPNGRFFRVSPSCGIEFWI